jgi:acetylornithine deacetylase
MNPFELTRALVDIESITDNEEAVGDYLFQHLATLAARTNGKVERMPAEPNRDNIFAVWDTPTVTFSTHIDTVPPFFPSREDDEFIWGRGSCDTKGIIAAMIAAIEKLLAAGIRDIGLLLVVGEERNSAGAKVAEKNPRGSKFIINGEPTENQLALGSKGALRYELISRGKLAHSAYPHLGHSAINTLLDVLQDIRQISLPTDELLGPSTLNIGTICGGRAPNVIADEARAELMFRTVGDPASTKNAVLAAVNSRLEAKEVLDIRAVRLTAIEGIPTTVVAFTTDIPSFGTAWGKPFLIGPGSIHLAHTAEERIPKKQLLEAIEIYTRMATQLLATGEAKK